MEMGCAAHLEPARSPRIDAGELAITIATFGLAFKSRNFFDLAKPWPPTSIALLSSASREADLYDVRSTIRVGGGEAGEPLAFEVLEFVVGEGSHRRLGSLVWLCSAGNVC